MEHSRMQRFEREVSVVGLGTWQLGADWGSVAPEDARATLETAVEAGVTFFDTADVYGDGRSEQFCGELRLGHPNVFIATKMGRRVEQVAARELGELLDPGVSLAQFALRWVIDQPGVSTVIPGARNPDQVRGNAASASLPPLSEQQLAGVKDVYDRLIREHVHHRW